MLGGLVSEKRKTILIVDDEQALRQSFAYYFEDCDWNVMEAASGEEALMMLDTQSPDCALVDIRMAQMDGNEFIRQAHKKNQDLFFITCTGSLEYEIPEDIACLGCVSNQIFTKPVRDMGILEEAFVNFLKK